MVTLKEVLESADYDFTTLDDAQWLISQVAQFEQLVIEAEDFISEEQDRIDAEELAESKAAYALAFPKED
jgi:hypothetical protein